MSTKPYYRPAYDPAYDGEYSSEVHGAVAVGRFLAALAFAAVGGDVEAFEAVVTFPSRPMPSGRFGEGRRAPRPTAEINLRHGAQTVVEAITADRAAAIREAALAAIITEALAVTERAEAAKARINAVVAAAAETGYTPDDAMRADARIIITASSEMLALRDRADALLDDVADLDDLDLELWGQRVSRAMADMAWKAAEYGHRGWVEIAEHEDD